MNQNRRLIDETYEQENKLMERVLLTSIQRFSLHDGPGIRTTVFMKGCGLRCPWCSNPENICREPQTYNKEGFHGIYGKYYSPKKLVEECLKDRLFYSGEIVDSSLWAITNNNDIERLPGGVTFSGGEALLQIKQLVPVCKMLHAEKVHITVETSLFIPTTDLEIAINNIDLFYVDVKILDEHEVSKIEHGNLALYLTNLNRIMSCNRPVIIRIPVIGLYTDTAKNRTEVKKLLTKYKKQILKIELIKEHRLGESKYHSLNMEIDYHGVSDEFMEQYKTELLDLGIPIEICKI